MNIQKSINKIVRERESKKRKYERVRKVLVLVTVLFLGIFIGSFFMQSNFSITGYVASGVLPTVGGDSGNWGTILNDYLSQEHTAEGGHKNVTVQGNLTVEGTINVTDWTNVSITESQISDLHIWNSTNSSYRTLDNLTFEGDINVSGNLNVTGNLTINGNISQSETPDANTLYAKSLPKAWVNFDGTDCDPEICTIRDSFNVDNVTKDGTGIYTIYWDRDFADTNYAVVTNRVDRGGQTSEAYMVILRLIPLQSVR